MIYTTTLNPSIDYILKVDKFNEGKTNRAYYDAKIPGGKGIMVSKLLCKMNIDSQNLGFIGGYTGEFIENELKKLNISNRFVHIGDDTRINVKLKSNVETEVNANGPNVNKAEIEKFFKIIHTIKEGDLVVLSGSIPSSLNSDFYKQIIVELKKMNVNFIIDTTGQKLLEVLKYRPLLVKPNKEELEELFNTKLHSLLDIKKYGKKLLDLGSRNVIVSLGGDGAVFINKKISLYAPAIKGELVHSVGAGDSMIGGFIYGIENRIPDIESFKWAVAAGTATAFSEDIGERGKIENFYKKVKLKQF